VARLARAESLADEGKDEGLRDALDRELILDIADAVDRASTPAIQTAKSSGRTEARAEM
jgi:hypothetical protein